MLLRFLFGEDVFISYSRRDGAAYAAALANELSKPGSGLSCFLDQWGASAADDLSSPVLRALRRSRVLVLVGTPGASASTMVRKEVSLFSKHHAWLPHRPIVPLNVDGGLDHVSWTELTGLHRVAETREPRRDGVPSPSIARLIRDSCTFTTRNQRVRLLSLAAAALLVISVGAGMYALEMTRAATSQERLALENAAKAQEQEHAAKANLERAAEHEAIAKTNAKRAEAQRQRAEQQARLAVSRQLSASAALMVQNGNLLPEGVRTAIRALRMEEQQTLIEGHQALRNGLALLPRMVSQMPHKFAVRFASLSREGSVLATADAEVVSVWDTTHSRLIAARSYRGTALVTSLALSPDARLVAIGYGGTLEILRVPPAALEGAAPDPLTTLVFRPVLRQPERPAFSPDGRYFAAIGDGGGLTRVWTVADWKERDEPGSTALGFSPDGAYLFLAGRNMIQAVAMARDGTKIERLQMPPATAITFSADGSHLAAADETSVRTWRWAPASRGWQESESITHQGRVTTLAVSSDGRMVSVGSGDGTARVWNLAERRELLRLTHNDTVTATSFSRDGRSIVTAGADGLARMWDTTPDVSTQRLPHATNVRALAFGPTAEVVWTIADDGRVRRWHMPPETGAQGQMLDSGPAMSDGVAPYSLVAAAFDPRGRHAGVAVSDGTVFLWNLAAGTSTELIVDSEITTMAVGPGGDVVAVAGEKFEVWATGQTPAQRLAFDGAGERSVSFSPDGRYLAAAAAGQLRVFDLTSGTRVRTLRTVDDVSAMEFNSKGTLLAIADDHNRVSTWEWLKADARPVQVSVEPGKVATLKFSSDDRNLAYAVAGRISAIWDLSNHRELARLTHGGEVTGLGFSPDGRYLGTASSDRLAAVSLWRAADLIHEAEARLSRRR